MNVRRSEFRVQRSTFQLVLAILAALLSIAPGSAQGQDPDVPTYAGWAREALAAAQRSDRIGLEVAGGRLVAVRAVRLPDGSSVTVDYGWLRDELQRSDPDFRTIASRLGATVDALAAPASSAPGDAQERLRAILSRPPFAEPAAAASSWLEDLIDWFFRVLDAIFRPVGDTIGGPAGSALAWTIGIGGGLLLLVVFVYLAVGLRRNMAAEARAAEDDPEASLTARTAFEQASDLARGGDNRTAVRYLYLAALLWLDEHGKLRYDRTLTNREYLERVAANPALRARLAPVVETFDRVWYGHDQLDAESFAAYRAQVEELRSER